MNINLPSRPKTASKCTICGKPTYDMICAECEVAAEADARRKQSVIYSYEKGFSENTLESLMICYR